MTAPRRPSPEEARAHLAQIQGALHAVSEGNLPPLEAVVWPSSLDRALLSEIPLPTRTSNCLSRANLANGQSEICVLALMQIPNFGRRSLAELLLTLEKYLIDCSLAPNDSKHDLPEPDASVGASDTLGAQHSTGDTNPEVSNPDTENLSSLLESIDRLSPLVQRWGATTEGFRSLLATSADILGTTTLADALKPELMHLACRMGLDNSLQSVGLHEATLGTPGLPVLVSRRLHEMLTALSKRQRFVVQARFARSPPATLEQVGLKLNVTRERVRQIQVKLKSKIDTALGGELDIIAATLRERLDPVIAADELERLIDQISPLDSTTVTALFRIALIRAMGFTFNDGVYTNAQAEQVIRDLYIQARELADDVGLVQEQDLVNSLPGEKWLRFWQWLRRRSGLHNLYGSLALRDSAKARAKAALLSLGRPATRDEIGAVCGQEPKRVGANLSNIPSVVKADRDRWGLRHWIDDEYDGIVGEIVQRIEEDGGVTTTERLLREIPAKFKVNPQSVRAYMYTPRFEVWDGSIRLANPTSVSLRDLDDVIDGRDQDDAPYWTFVVEDRYFQGYSVVGLPAEVAKALGCEPDSGVDVEVQNLPDCRALSLNWRLASLTGASLGRVAEPLGKLGLQPGDRARVTIAASRAVVLGLHDESGPTGGSLEADATLERMLRRRRAI